MYPMRLVFLIVGISTILSSTVFGGESPNEDRIGDILSLMTGVSERVDGLVKNVGKMETKVDNIDTMEKISAEKISKMENEISKVKFDVSSMSSKINEVEKKVSSTKSKVSTIESDVASTKSKVSTIQSDVAVVKKSVGWKFVGMGSFVTEDEWYNADSNTLAGCIGSCTDKHSSDSNWNGVNFRPRTGNCWCYKNDVGHDSSSAQEWMHFKFE